MHVIHDTPMYFRFYQHRNKHLILTEWLRIASNEISLFHYVSHLLMQNSNRKKSIWNADCMGCTMPIHLFYQTNVLKEKKYNVHELALMSSIWFVFDEYFMHKSHCKWIKKYFLMCFRRSLLLFHFGPYFYWWNWIFSMNQGVYSGNGSDSSGW